MNRLIYNTSTSSKRSLWPPETAGLWVVGAWESELELSNGEKYTDWASALGANTLGFSAFHKNAPYWFQPATSLPWQIEHDFAEEFCQAMNTEAVRFFKSGSDAVSCAVRLARGFTERPGIIVFDKCYHGTGDWFGPALWTQGGIDPGTETIVLPWGFDLNEWIRRPTGIAAVVVEPVPKAVLLPPDGWLQHLREVCDQHGILLISDEIILGYRHSLRGYLRSAGIVPDLACYGKAMAQGAALSACTGRLEVMKLLEKEVHFSGTNNGEPLPLQIAQWTLKEYLKVGSKNYAYGSVTETLNLSGLHLKDMLHDQGIKTEGLASRFEVVFDTDEVKKSAVKYCFDHGILFPGWCSMAVSHTVDQIQRLVDTLKAWRNQ